MCFPFFKKHTIKTGAEEKERAVIFVDCNPYGNTLANIVSVLFAPVIVAGERLMGHQDDQG